MADNDWQMDWHYRWGRPASTGILKHSPEDFVVNEVLGFEPEWAEKGQHHWLLIEKRGLNTDFVARQLARFAGIPAKEVSFSGLKDRQAVTTQWFSVELPATREIVWADWVLEGATILSAHRGIRKLKRGAHKANEFVIRIRGLTELPEFEARLQKLSQGVPNYYGEQRFGRQRNNLTQALEMFAGKRIKDRNLRSLLLSSARSWLFNHCVSQRLAELDDTALLGDVVQLSGSHSQFTLMELDDSILNRLATGDIRLTAPLYGRGLSSVALAAAEREDSFIAERQEWLDGLVRAGVNADRRPMLLVPTDLSVELSDDEAVLSFSLETGAFATSVLRELLVTQEAGSGGSE
ncbi:MAG: tRNA pseudouridine(13) synthase TruD [Idiomarina sp.]|nr:tRNA pseudouridine(13) synthase TruD [Idiomarina sp.]